MSWGSYLDTTVEFDGAQVGLAYEATALAAMLYAHAGSLYYRTIELR